MIPELTHTDLDNKDQDVRQTYLWSVLYATGYLTDAGKPEHGIHKFIIPNLKYGEYMRSESDLGLR